MVSNKRKRSWHRRKVLVPWPISIEWQGRSIHFLQTLEARWSESRRRWLWRIPDVATPARAD